MFGTDLYYFGFILFDAEQRGSIFKSLAREYMRQ
jgi:hypothetical protein